MNKIAYRLCGLFLTCILSMSAVVPVYAASDSDTVENHGSIGAVDISIDHHFTDDTVMILPNSTVDITSGVYNKAKSAWIRAKIDYPFVGGENATDDMDLPGDVLVDFAEGNWKKIGEWYYYTEPVDSETEIPFTKSITFPADWDNKYVDSNFDMNFTAQAVQSKNFTPDFNSEDPWHGVVIESFDADSYNFKTAGSETFKVDYKGGAEGLVHTGEDFFSNWEDQMPGDTVTDTAEIANGMNLPVKMYFSAASDGDTELLDKLHLKITNGDSVVFDDVLSKTLDKTLLKEYAAGESTEFKYELSVPAELTNSSALKDFQSIWTFECEEIPQEKPKPQKLVPDVKTSDMIQYGAAFVVSIVVVGGLIVISKKRKKGGDSHD